MNKVSVRAENGSYDIVIENGLLTRLSGYFTQYSGKRAFIVTDDNVAPFYLDALISQLSAAGVSSAFSVIPAGERSKSFAQLTTLFPLLAKAGIKRGDLIIALGGGVVGDLSGFLASMWLRGVPYIQIPTTLLSQVDSSVGGKTAVDIPEGKNLVGAFYQPKAVFIDPSVLETLPEREISAGMAEVIKYGCIYDPAFFGFLEKVGSLDKLKDNYEKIIARSCEIKADYVFRDPFDRGVRTELNLGHTLGHGLETVLGFGTLLHGEAVAIGTAAAAKWSEKILDMPSSDSARIIALLTAFGLDVNVPKCDRARLLSAMRLDKKAESGGINFVLLERIGKARVMSLKPEELLEADYER